MESHEKYLIVRIERLQRKFTKDTTSVASHPYMDRLGLLNLPTLEKCRLWADFAITLLQVRKGTA